MSTDLVPLKQEDITLALQIGVPAAIINQLTPVQKGWVFLSKQKEELVTVLTKSELSVQGFLKDITLETDLAKVQEKVKKAKGEAESLKECRLIFTRKLDEKLFNPLMEYEKRTEKLLSDATAHEKTLKIKVANTATAENKKAAAKTQFKAHFENERERIEVAYRLALKNLVQFYYKGALEQKMPVAGLAEYKKTILEELPKIALSPVNKFVNDDLTVEEKTELYSTIVKYDGKEDLQEAIESVETKFALYENDLQSAEEAIKSSEAEMQATEKEAAEGLEISTAINNLAATAGTVFVAAPKIKKVQKIVEYESYDFLILVLTNVLKKMEQIKPKIKSKSIMKISVQQFVDALGKHVTETGEKLVGLKTEEEVK